MHRNATSEAFCSQAQEEPSLKLKCFAQMTFSHISDRAIKQHKIQDAITAIIGLKCFVHTCVFESIGKKSSQRLPPRGWTLFTDGLSRDTFTDALGSLTHIAFDPLYESSTSQITS